MIEITTGLHRHCDHLSRRDFVRVGGLAALGLGLGELLRLEARAAGRKRASADSAILVWLGGGLSHLDTFDPKPDAPAETREHFGTIPTRLAGVRFSDRLPRLAGALDQFCVVRSMT